MPHESPVPPETRREIACLYTEEMLSTREISERLFWSKSTVRSVLAQEGIPRRPRGGRLKHKDVLTQDDLDRARELYSSGMSLQQLADILGIHKSTARHRLIRAGVQTRDKSNGIKLRRAAMIAQNGRRALTERQREVLEFVERRGGTVTSERVALALAWSIPTARQVLSQLRAHGLVSRKMKQRGRVREFIWWRSDLQMRDALEFAAMSNANWSGEWLPIAPFREWANRLVDQERRNVTLLAVTDSQRGSNGSGWMSTTGAVAQRLGIGERRLHAILHDQKNISLALADRALQNAGTGMRLEDLWPELGREDELDSEFFQKRGYGVKAAA